VNKDTKTLMDKARAEVEKGSKVDSAKDWVIHQVWGATGHTSWAQTFAGGVVSGICSAASFLAGLLPFGGVISSAIALAEKPAVEAIKQKMANKRLGLVNSQLSNASPNLKGLALRVEQMKLGQQLKVKELPGTILNDLYDIKSRFDAFTKAVQDTDRKLGMARSTPTSNPKGVETAQKDVTKGCYAVAHSYYDLAQKVMTLRQDVDTLKVWLSDLEDQTEIFEAHVVGYDSETQELLDEYFAWSKPGGQAGLQRMNAMR
jgi:hypothetical protein